MTIAWILYVLLVGTLLAIGAGGVARALALAGRSTRWVWAASLVGIAAFAVVAPTAESFGRGVTATITSVQTSSTTETAGPDRGIGSVVRLAREAVASTVARGIAAVGARVPSVVATPVTIAWVLASVVLFAIYLGVSVQLSRARREWPRERLHGITVRIAPAAGPAVIGMMHAEIVVPRSLLDRSADEQRLILDHEQEHLRSGDHVLLALACLAAIALPWHPAVWYALARLRLAIELDCDARVLRRGAPPRSYGALLIDMAARGTGFRVGTLALADRPSHLERRILAMRTTRSRFILLRAGALCAGAGLLVLAACEAKIPTAADIASMDVASAEKSAAEAGLMRTQPDGKADFFVNGVNVSAAHARAMEAKNIGSIEVVKSELASGRDTIFVTTTDRMPPYNEFEKAARGAKERGETEFKFENRKQTADPAEHLVAHVEGELAAVRAEELGVPAPPSKPRMMLRTPGGSGQEPLFVIDGKKVSSREFGNLRQEDVASVQVLKDKMAARAAYSDPAAKNGVILVETKAAKKH